MDAVANNWLSLFAVSLGVAGTVLVANRVPNKRQILGMFARNFAKHLLKNVQ